MQPAVIITLILLSPGVFAAEDLTPSVTLELTQSRLSGNDQAQLLIAVDLKGEPVKTVLTIETPAGLRAEPASITYDTPPREFRPVVRISGSDSALPVTDGQIVVSLAMPGSGRPQPVMARAPITYRPQISFWKYLAWGVAGVVIGYILRLLVKALAAVTPADSASQAGAAAPPLPGSITAFVTQHYYPVDMAVTIVLGFLALLYLAPALRPPDNASTWAASLTLGVFLGGLTNSELFSRLGK